MMRLNGKKIIVTGGSRGLGSALALHYAQEGAKVAICGREPTTLQETAAEIQAVGQTVFSQQCDVADSAQVQLFVNNVLEKFGGIDVLVNNAGILGPRVSVAEYPVSEWKRVVQTNINGLFYMTRAVVPVMMIQKSGAIINVSSSVGRTGRQKWGAYAVSKFATEGFTQVLAEELRPYHITVNSVNPGSMRTDMRREAYPNENPELLRDPSEVAEVFIYLASDDGAGITAQAFDAANYYAPPKGM